MSHSRNQTLTTRQVQNLRAKAAEGASGVISRLRGCVAGDVRLTGTQIQAARILLSKCLPDLSSVDIQHSGDAGGVQINIVRLSQSAPEPTSAVTLTHPTGSPEITAQRGSEGLTVDSSLDTPIQETAGVRED